MREFFDDDDDDALSQKPTNVSVIGERDVDTYFPYVTAGGLEEYYGSEIEWLVDGLLPREGLAVLFGRYGCQKSFVCVHLAHCVAHGLPFFGRKTKKDCVLYLAAESPEDYTVRNKGWRLANNIEKPSDNLVLCRKPVNFLDERQVRLVNYDLLKQLNFFPSLIIIDPLADCLVGGEENSSSDMFKALSGIQSIARDFGAMALVVHHTGKDGKLRGHSALPSAANTIIEVHASAAGDRVTLTVEKQRSGPKGLQIVLDSKVFSLPKGQTTRVLSEAEHSDRVNAEGPNGRAVTNAETAIQTLRPGITDGEWRDVSGLKGGTFDRAKKRLLDSGRVLKRGNCYFPAPQAPETSPDRQPHPTPL